MKGQMHFPAVIRLPYPRGARWMWRRTLDSCTRAHQNCNCHLSEGKTKGQQAKKTKLNHWDCKFVSCEQAD